MLRRWLVCPVLFGLSPRGLPKNLYMWCEPTGFMWTMMALAVLGLDAAEAHEVLSVEIEAGHQLPPDRQSCDARGHKHQLWISLKMSISPSNYLAFPRSRKREQNIACKALTPGCRYRSQGLESLRRQLSFRPSEHGQSVRPLTVDSCCFCHAGCIDRLSKIFRRMLNC